MSVVPVAGDHHPVQPGAGQSTPASQSYEREGGREKVPESVCVKNRLVSMPFSVWERIYRIAGNHCRGKIVR